jgi:hypothetical protein
VKVPCDSQEARKIKCKSSIFHWQSWWKCNLWFNLERLNWQKVKPIVVSMGNYAASGGYIHVMPTLFCWK